MKYQCPAYGAEKVSKALAIAVRADSSYRDPYCGALGNPADPPPKSLRSPSVRNKRKLTA